MDRHPRRRAVYGLPRRTIGIDNTGRRRAFAVSTLTPPALSSAHRSPLGPPGGLFLLKVSCQKAPATEVGMVRNVALLLGAFSLSAATSNPKDTVTISSLEGGALVSACQERDGFGFDSCVGYILGVMDAASLAGAICPSGGSITGKAIGVVRKFIRDHPEHWDRAPVWLVQEPLRSVFPCPSQGTRR